MNKIKSNNIIIRIRRSSIYYTIRTKITSNKTKTTRSQQNFYNKTYTTN